MQKLSITISKQQFDFIEQYQAAHHFKTQSEVIEKALKLLQEEELESCYKAANAEIRNDLNMTSGDGVDDETW